ncbi:jumonji domain containing 4, transcript variant X2 [Ictidomys tridecemlineatus]|uniref:2-oxoglutarate and iron-dependent oxygenase JMJD4 isoform X2 n=1 Tax=Ictidomys tridecemlineatus TaxID=43179 RepID=UPI000B538E6A|nr:2-oxoglutarate and iron-dependent oxygenase JMJD4 isoform X2 [Ictidomys tridecemlineatus]KAG3265115.1 jumonji domain containing 4, transcript variant X2 [Ictidomys tridecemlineatus]
MDRETRAFAEQHFRDLGGQLYGGGGQAPSGVAFIKEPATFSYADFVKAFLLPNRPCVFSSAFTENWGSRRRWVTPEGKPDFEYLLQKYGDVVVPVANCGVQEYNSNPKEHMPLREYISYWLEYVQRGCSSPRGCLYLKDWHVCRDSSAEDLGDVFTLPVYFSSDWLNEFWDALDVDDYRFVYAGPPGTWSPFHADIFRSFSWSANICGRKKWLFFPPGQEEALRDCHGSLPYDVTSPKLLDTRLHPMLQHSSPPLEVTQEAGEVVFVPSGWHHQVHNLVIMRSCSGINFEEFYHFLKVIAERRLLVLGQGSEAAQEENIGLGLGFQQAAFDVGRLAEVLASVVIHPDFQRVDTSTFSPGPEELLCQLQDAVAATTTL